MDRRVFIKPGDTVEVILPHSEVCMHMRVAGKRAKVELTTSKFPAAQIRRENGMAFSNPVLTGEAGLYYDDAQGFYYYPIDMTVGVNISAEWLK
jgi:hypothetical protein